MKKTVLIFISIIVLAGCYGEPKISPEDGQLDTEKRINLGYDYSKDDNHVYRKGELIEALDPKTTEIIIDGMAGDCSGYLVKDIDSLFFDDLYSLNVVHDADIEPFAVTESRMAGGSQYYKNNKSVYIFGPNYGGCVTPFLKIEGADPATFQYLGHLYAKDKNHVYSINRIVEEADVDSFEVFSDPNGYAKDKNHVYINDRRVHDADPKTFDPKK